jgi:hypothetical protein
MANGTPQDLSDAGIRAAASETVREGTDIRAKVHELTLLALNAQRFDRHGMREVIRAVTEGAATGAEKTTADMRLAMSEALRGMDQALRTSAEAGHMALKTLAATGKHFSDSEFKTALANPGKLEDDFLTPSGRCRCGELAVQSTAKRPQRATTGTETGARSRRRWATSAEVLGVRLTPRSRDRGPASSASRPSRAASRRDRRRAAGVGREEGQAGMQYAARNRR